MVSRIELVLGAMILFFATKGIYVSNIATENSAVSQEKSIELFRLQHDEVNATAIQHRISASHMVKYTDRTVFEDFRLTTETWELLAKEAILKDAVIILDKNATLTKVDGTRFDTEEIRYDRRTRQLSLPEHFSMQDHYGDVKGSALKYHADQGILIGKKIKAQYEIK